MWNQPDPNLDLHLLCSEPELNKRTPVTNGTKLKTKGKLYELRMIPTFVFVPDDHRILMEWFGLEGTLKIIQFQPHSTFLFLGHPLTNRFKMFRTIPFLHLPQPRAEMCGLIGLE